MARGSDNRKNVRIGKDGRIYMGGTGGGNNGTSMPPNASDKSQRGCFFWVVLLLIVVAFFFFNHESRNDASSAKLSTPVTQESPVSSVEKSSSSTSLSSSDVEDWVTVEGIIRRSEQTTAETGMGWSRVVFYLELDKRTTITYINGFGDVSQADVDWIAIEVLEQYGDDADKSLSSVYDARWDNFVGMHATVTGQPFDSGNAHAVGPVMLVNTRAIGA